MMNVAFLPAERLDEQALDAVAELEMLCFAEPWSRQALQLLLTDQAVGAVVRTAQGEVVAYGGMLLAPEEGQITNIAVHPTHRGQGIGGAVLDHLLRFAAEQHLAQVVLEVRKSNQAAIGLYQSRKFTVAGERKRFYRLPTEDAWVMLLPLEQGRIQ